MVEVSLIGPSEVYAPAEATWVATVNVALSLSFIFEVKKIYSGADFLISLQILCRKNDNRQHYEMRNRYDKRQH